MKRFWVLMVLLMIAYKGQCNELLSDTLRPIAPKGYVLLTYSGARNALKTKVQADACMKSLAAKDSVLYYTELQANMATTQKVQAMTALDEARKANKLLKRKLFWRTLQGVGVVMLVVGLNL